MLANYKILTLSKVGGDIEVVFDLVGFEMDPAVRFLSSYVGEPKANRN